MCPHVSLQACSRDRRLRLLFSSKTSFFWGGNCGQIPAFVILYSILVFLFFFLKGISGAGGEYWFICPAAFGYKCPCP